MAPEIAAFLREQPRELPYSELAAACAARFGTDAAPDAEAIRRWWLAGAGATTRARIARDLGVAAFILDLVGRQSPAQIMMGLRERFPARRVPSRSALYRFLAEERRNAIALARAAEASTLSPQPAPRNAVSAGPAGHSSRTP